MTWTIKRVEKELNTLSRLYNDEFSIPVSLNGRFSSTLGRVNLRVIDEVMVPIGIEFSKKFLADASDESIIDVIKHEWAHYYITKRTGENQGHNSYFKELCDELGTCGKTQTTVNYIKEQAPVVYKYDIFCSCCGKLVGSYKTANAKAVKTPERFTSNCCGKSIRVVQNY